MLDNRKENTNRFSDEEIFRFRSYLLSWGNSNIRSYPWRYLDDPYMVIVSEFMLHRTQTKQVVPIYERFIEQYPTLSDHVEADRSEVEIILRPLGLSWRIQGMLNALEDLWYKHGEVPVIYELLLSVPTVGQYIAGAVVCFTINQPLTLIDSNIVRVVGRVFGLDLSGEARRKKPVIQAITAVVDPVQPQDFYYGLIDLAHNVCRPQNPSCSECPLLKIPCRYGAQIFINS
jgi:A/G-specific adenine glycosylase